MKIQLNGEPYETSSKTIQELLNDLDIKPDFVAVELNRKIIKKCDLAGTCIGDGDNIEIVKFVGGG